MVDRKIIETDFLVLGSGIAGLWFALKAAESGSVVIATKKGDSESNTNYAQGGIAAALDDHDSPAIHFEDTIRAGGGLAHDEAVRVTTTEGPKLVAELVDIGVRFSHAHHPSGKTVFDLGQEGGHSRRRIVHAKDSTGSEVEQGLLHALRRKGVTILENHFCLDLAVSGGADAERECTGARVLDLESAALMHIPAKATLLATGGIGQVYLHTTNPRIATGDGIAMAFRAGARVANMEFIQFHPTSLYGSTLDDRSFLISEAVRGEGGVLKTLDGAPFMDRYHPMANLAPRDVIARAIDAELKKRIEPHVLLDVTHLDKNFIRGRFPKIYSTCLEFGIDITRRPIPVVPAAHYVCGGILTDLWARTSISRLFAAGECACSGVHGANRLASNSLLEGLVFADRAAAKAKEYLAANPRTAPRGPLFASLSASIRVLPPTYTQSAEAPHDTIADLRMRLKELMWTDAAIVRTTAGLAAAWAELETLEREAAGRLMPGTVSVETAEFRNMLVVARLIIRCALERKESRGLHYNADYPNRDDGHFKHDTIIDSPL